MNPMTASKRTMDSFPKLRPLLEYLDGLDQPAELDVLRRLLQELDVCRDDLGPACVFKDKKYQRNLIRGTEWYELVCLCWMSGQRTPIHDHAGSSCAFLVVEGEATEIRYEHTPSGLICPAWTRRHQPGYVCASSEADIHQVANTQPHDRCLITLHCYSPRLRRFSVYSLDTPTAAAPQAVNPQKQDAPLGGE